MCNSSYLAAKPIRRHRPVGLRAESHTPPALAAGCQKSRLLPVEAELAQLSRRREAPLALPQTQAAQSGPAAARARAWVSRNQFGNAPCSWNIDSIGSIGYCQTNSFNCTTCSCQRDVSQSEEKLRKHPFNFGAWTINKPAATYARVSSDRQKENHTIASQTAALAEYAQARDPTKPPAYAACFAY